MRGISYTGAMAKRTIYGVCAMLCTIAVTTQAQTVQLNHRNRSSNEFSISSTAIDAGMVGTFSNQHTKVSPNPIGEVTLPVSPINDNDTLFGENKGSDVDNFVNNENLGNHGDVSLVPEGSTWSMLLLGCGMLVAMMRFRKPRHS
jgi:hypothetical protein